MFEHGRSTNAQERGAFVVRTVLARLIRSTAGWIETVHANDERTFPPSFWRCESAGQGAPRARCSPHKGVMAMSQLREKKLKPNTALDSGQVRQFVLPDGKTRITQITTFCPDFVGPGPTNLYLIDDDALILLTPVFPPSWQNTSSMTGATSRYLRMSRSSGPITANRNLSKDSRSRDTRLEISISS